MHLIEVGARRFRVDRATESDVPAIVALLAQDPLGALRELPDMALYLAAFRDIDSDPHQYPASMRAEDDQVVGTMQLSLISGLARGGTRRLQIEAVRLAPDIRGIGVGSALFEWAHDYGRRHGATLAQLTTDKTRDDAHRFYGQLGYQASHEGLKRDL